MGMVIVARGEDGWGSYHDYTSFEMVKGQTKITTLYFIWKFISTYLLSNGYKITTLFTGSFIAVSLQTSVNSKLWFVIPNSKLNLPEFWAGKEGSSSAC
jgi:hypothetical protein